MSGQQNGYEFLWYQRVGEADAQNTSDRQFTR